MCSRVEERRSGGRGGIWGLEAICWLSGEFFAYSSDHLLTRYKRLFPSGFLVISEFDLRLLSFLFVISCRKHSLHPSGYRYIYKPQ